MANILLADDDELLCELVQARLEAAGHDVTIVGNGEAAVAAIAAGMPDLLILDTMMPVTSGHEVLHILKDNERTTLLPVLMLTARKGSDDVLVALRTGAADYITKPFIPDELALRVESILAKKG